MFWVWFDNFGEDCIASAAAVFFFFVIAVHITFFEEQEHSWHDLVALVEVLNIVSDDKKSVVAIQIKVCRNTARVIAVSDMKCQQDGAFLLTYGPKQVVDFPSVKFLRGRWYHVGLVYSRSRFQVRGCHQIFVIPSRLRSSAVTCGSIARRAARRACTWTASARSFAKSRIRLRRLALCLRPSAPQSLRRNLPLSSGVLALSI